MKRIFLFLAVVASATVFQSCTGDDGAPGAPGPNSLVYEIRNQNLTLDPDVQGQYIIYNTFSNTIGGDLFDAETLLVYRLSSTFNNGTPVWQLIPRTLYSSAGELDYDYDFSPIDFTIYASGTYNPSQTPALITNQTFRLVVIPGTFANKSATPVNFEDYDAVLKYYKIDGSNVKVVK